MEAANLERERAIFGFDLAYPGFGGPEVEQAMQDDADEVNNSGAESDAGAGAGIGEDGADGLAGAVNTSLQESLPEDADAVNAKMGVSTSLQQEPSQEEIEADEDARARQDFLDAGSSPADQASFAMPVGQGLEGLGVGQDRSGQGRNAGRDFDASSSLFNESTIGGAQLAPAAGAGGVARGSNASGSQVGGHTHPHAQFAQQHGSQEGTPHLNQHYAQQQGHHQQQHGHGHHQQNLAHAGGHSRHMSPTEHSHSSPADSHHDSHRRSRNAHTPGEPFVGDGKADAVNLGLYGY